MSIQVNHTLTLFTVYIIHGNTHSIRTTTFIRSHCIYAGMVAVVFVAIQALIYICT